MKPGKLFTHLHASYQGEKAEGSEGKGRFLGYRCRGRAGRQSMANANGGSRECGRKGGGREGGEEGEWVGNSSADFSK